MRFLKTRSLLQLSVLYTFFLVHVVNTIAKPRDQGSGSFLWILEAKNGKKPRRKVAVPELPELPEGCISHIIGFTSPRDACVLSSVSKTFRSAADSNYVWEKLLPADYRDMLSRSAVPINLMDYPSKKQLYLRMCSSSDPILLDGGTKSLSLERTTGKKCVTVGARELGIGWGDWQWRSDYASRFPEVAELILGWWLDINGKMGTRMLSTKTMYGVYLLIKHADVTYALDETPVEASVSFVGGTVSGSRKCFLKRSTGPGPHRYDLRHRPTRAAEGPYFPSQRGDEWLEIEVGEFYNDIGEDGEVQVCVKERRLNGKGGLIVEGFEFRPKAFVS